MERKVSLSATAGKCRAFCEMGKLFGCSLAPIRTSDHVMAAGGQERGQLSTDQAGRTGDRHRQGRQSRSGSVPVCRDVVGQLAVPVNEPSPSTPVPERVCRRGRSPASGRRWRFPRSRGCAAIALRGRSAAMPTRRCRSNRRTCLGRVVAIRLVLSHPAQTGRETEFGTSVLQRIRLGDQLRRLPRRRQSGERTRSGVPIEHLVDGCVDHARVHKSHDADGTWNGGPD